MGIVGVHKDVRFLGKSGEMAVVKICKDVSLLDEKRANTI